MPAEIMPRPTETNAERPCYPVNRTNTMLIALGRVFPLLQGLGGYTRRCADAPPQKELHKTRGTKPRVNRQKANRAKEVKASLLLENKDYKGLSARGRRKIQTHCHLRGNLFCLGEEQAPTKSTNLGQHYDQAARDSRETIPRSHGT